MLKLSTIHNFLKYLSYPKEESTLKLAEEVFPFYMDKDTSYQKIDFDDFKEFVKAIPFILSNQIPILLVYQHLPLSLKKSGVYEAPLANSLAHGNHGAVITGVGYHDRNQQTYYRIQNSHEGSETIYLSKRYLDYTYKYSEVYIPKSLLPYLLDYIDSY